jgi:hypothetical protein
MSKRSRKEILRARRRRAKLRSRIIWGSIGLAAAAAVGLILWNAGKPAAGQELPTLPADHVPEGSQPGPYNSDPPTSGSHYASPMRAGFYEPGDPETELPYPEGYLVHSLEHGYVIFWYNCDPLTEDECQELKDGIRQVMAARNNFKLVAFPWPSLDVPVVMTSWGRMLEMASFDPGAAENFISANLNRAPEPSAP